MTKKHFQWAADYIVDIAESGAFTYSESMTIERAFRSFFRQHCPNFDVKKWNKAIVHAKAFKYLEES